MDTSYHERAGRVPWNVHVFHVHTPDDLFNFIIGSILIPHSHFRINLV